MYQREDDARAARSPDGLAVVAPGVRAGHAVARVRQALADAPPGLSLDPAVLSAALAVPLPEPHREGDRCFALGWLRWLAGASRDAEPLLAQAADLLPAKSPEALQAAYWLARVRLLNGRGEALAAFEQVLRSLAGSPRPARQSRSTNRQVACGEPASERSTCSNPASASPWPFSSRTRASQ